MLFIEISASTNQEGMYTACIFSGVKGLNPQLGKNLLATEPKIPVPSALIEAKIPTLCTASTEDISNGRAKYEEFAFRCVQSLCK